MTSDATAGGDATSTARRRVLIVDDEAGFRNILKRMLESAGYDVRTAIDAHSALASIAEVAPAVALCDIHMPGPDGLWLATQIRANSPCTAIVLATSDETIPPSESLRNGIVAYVLKPLQREAVLAAVADGFRWFAAESRQELPAPLPVPDGDPGSDPNEPAKGASAPDTTARPINPRRGFGWTRPLAAALLLVAAAAAGIYEHELRARPARVLAMVAASSGAVIVEDGSGKPLKQGSGFFIAPDTFVTNQHVVNGASKGRITVANGDRVFEVTGLLAVHRRHDLVLLRTASRSSSYLKLNVDTPAVGDDISVYGAPLGLQGTLSRGIVSAVRTQPQPVLQISAPISPGSSGSAVINAEGEVVGVVVASRMEGQSLNFAVPATFVNDLLNTAGAVRPLIAAARGAGDDLERNELVGPVRMLTVFASEPFLSAVERLRRTYASTVSASDAARMAERQAIQYSKTILIFDRQGMLIEKSLGDDFTRTQYEYDERGWLKTIVDREGENVVKTWTFAETGPHRIEARSGVPPTQSTERIEYGDDGRILSEELRTGDRVVSTRWTYDGPGWPVANVPGSSAPPGIRLEYDAMGNLVRRIASDGTDVRFEYQFDAQGNWVSRETFRVDKSANRALIKRERRTIDYW